MTYYQFVGVDVAKDKFDVALETNSGCLHVCFSNNQKGYCAFSRWLNKYTSNPGSAWKQRGITNLLDTLKAQHVQLTNQLHSTQSDSAKKTLRKFIKVLEKEIAEVEKQIAEIIKQNPTLNENMKLITSIKGVGKLTAYKVLSHVPDMNHFTNAKQFAAFIGISPRQHQSGKCQGKTTISRLGDGRLRKAFYMAALVAKRFNKRLQPFVMRLQKNGKAPKAIICAVMRKLAHLVFGVLKNRKPFDVNYV